MLELPESCVISSQIEKLLKGKKVKSVEIASSPHGFAFYSGDQAAYSAALVGSSIEGAKQVGGIIELDLGEFCISFNDGASPRYYAAGEKYPEKNQLKIQFEDGGCIVCVVRMYGGMQLYAKGKNNNVYYLAAAEKPSPLEDEFDESYFAGIISGAKKTLSVKALLATEQRIPGLGNGCLQDILFFAGVHPKTKVSELDDDRVQRIYDSTKTTLKQMSEQGGRNTEKDLLGNAGGYEVKLSAKTLSYGCPACGGALTRQAYLGGNIYFCSGCQPTK